MTKDEFIQEYSLFGHRTDTRYDYHRATPAFSRWNLDKVRAHFDAVPCDCGHQECKGWKMRAKNMVRPEDCSVDPMMMFGPLGPPFTMMDAEQPMKLIPGGCSVPTGSANMGVSISEPNYTICEEGKEVGRFWFDEETGRFKFEGDMEASAQVFAAHILKVMNQ